MMNGQMILYACFMLVGVFISALSQVLLKKSAMRVYDSRIKEYLNPFVAGAYIIFFGATLLSVIAYKIVPLSMGPLLEATSYVYILIFGKVFFGETITNRKLIAICMIMLGISIYVLF